MLTGLGVQYRLWRRICGGGPLRAVVKGISRVLAGASGSPPAPGGDGPPPAAGSATPAIAACIPEAWVAVPLAVRVLVRLKQQ